MPGVELAYDPVQGAGPNRHPSTSNERNRRHQKHTDSPPTCPDMHRPSIVNARTSRAAIPTKIRGTPEIGRARRDFGIGWLSPTTPWADAYRNTLRAPIRARGVAHGAPSLACSGPGLAESHLPPIIGYFAKTHFVQVDAFFLSRHKSKFGPRDRILMRFFADILRKMRSPCPQIFRIFLQGNNLL